MNPFQPLGTSLKVNAAGHSNIIENALSRGRRRARDLIIKRNDPKIMLFKERLIIHGIYIKHMEIKHLSMGENIWKSCHGKTS